jgi:uncharacterized membrane protein YkoI
MPSFLRPRTLAALVLACASAAAWADVGPDQAAAAAARSHGGRVLSVDRAGQAYRVKLVTAKGEVRVVMVDAATGRPM